MIFAVIILLVISVYLFMRLLLMKKAIKNLKDDFIEVRNNKESESHLQISYLDKDLEKLAYELNKYVSDYFKDKEEYKRNVSDIRGEITSLSHDLRTPLTSILGYLEFINEDHMSEEQKEIISIIKRRSLGLNDLVEQLYEYTRLENEEYTLKVEKIDLYKIIQEHLLEFYNEFKNKDIDFKLVMPKESKPVWINADANCIKRILSNLTNNALKYTVGEAKVKLKVNNNEASITYVTTRGDLTDYDISHIFDRFYKKDLSRKEVSSSGLGLTITRLFTERMGGKIYAYGDEVYLYIICNFALVHCKSLLV